MNRIVAKPIAAALMIFALQASTLSQLHGAGGGKALIKEGLGRTWKGPTTAVLGRILTRRTTTAKTPAAATRSKTSPAIVSMANITFSPAADSGVDELLATAFTTNATEKTVMLELFRQVKKAYEDEVAKEGKSNNLAAAMTFFIASNVVAYHAADMPSDQVTEELYVSIRDAMTATPEISRLTNAEKQQTHDWLVYMGGFVLIGHINAKNTNDRSSLADFKAVADQSMRLVLGIGPGDFTPKLQPVSSAAPSSMGAYTVSSGRNSMEEILFARHFTLP